MPPASIRLPARMKNGIATSGNLSIARNAWRGSSNRLASEKKPMPSSADRPIDTATEMLNAKHSTIVMIIAVVMPSPYFCSSSSRFTGSR
jgi:hypothetical protein